MLRSVSGSRRYRPASWAPLGEIFVGLNPADSLCCGTAPVPTYPLYLFYHRGGTSHLASKDGVSGLLGVNVADGYAIESLVRTARSNVGLRTRNRNYGRFELGRSCCRERRSLAAFVED
ncbi:DUF6615 family protein [Ensifer sp. YR511]|uniref:DUF6615 family protein n=1 Tax=Ensifer sp. YR511 TaxID=1855294 RepID=UPI00352BDCC0